MAHDDAVLNGDGSWSAPPGSPFRSLTADEVRETQAMAETVTPRFGGHVVIGKDGKEQLIDPDADASWEEHHPVARAIWEKRGIKPKGGA